MTTPPCSATRSSAERKRSRPPRAYQQPNRDSMCGMQANVAGARYGEEPEYVASRPAHWTKRLSRKYDRADPWSVLIASIAVRSVGDRIRSASDRRFDIEP